MQRCHEQVEVEVHGAGKMVMALVLRKVRLFSPALTIQCPHVTYFPGPLPLPSKHIVLLRIHVYIFIFIFIYPYPCSSTRGFIPKYMLLGP